MLFSFDQWLLDKFERLGHKSQLYIGKDCFWWAHCFLVIASLFFLLPKPPWGNLTHILQRITSGKIIITVFLFFFIRLGIYYNETQVKSKLDNGFINPKRLLWQVRIILIIALAILDILSQSSMFSLCSLGFMIVIYFVACTPLPPAPSKLKEWLKNRLRAVKKFFTTMPQEVPVPVPSN